MVRPEIVITGCGVINALAVNAEQLWAALRSGQGGLGAMAATGGPAGESSRLSALFASVAPGGPQAGPQAAGEGYGRIADFGAAAAIDANRRRRMPRMAQLAIVAAQQAVGQSISGSRAPDAATAQAAVQALTGFYGADRVGVSFGTALGALDLTVEFMAQYIAGGLASASPATFPYTVLNTPAALIAMELGLRGPNVTVNHRDLSAIEGIASACDLLLCGRADAVLAGGADELSQSLLHAYRSLSVLSCDGGAAADREGRKDQPCARPYDRRRRGLCPGEGATLFLLERAEAAERRGARILGRIAGYGRGGDARSRVGWRAALGVEASEPHGAVGAVHSALRMADLKPTDVSCVAGSGNGTDLERLETEVLRAALGPVAEQVAVSSILGRSGEWPASVAARVAQALFMLGEQALPACDCGEPDGQAALPGLCRGTEAQPQAVHAVLVPSFAQGGGNLALIVTGAAPRAHAA